MKITIAGGTGFIGDYLVKSLRQNSDNKLSVLYKNQLKNKFPGVDYFQVDSGLETAVTDSECLVILTRPNPKLLNQILKSPTKLQKIIYASTLLLYPDSKTIQKEELQIEPVNDYEKEKAFEETLLAEFVKNKKTRLIIARIANVYGDIKNRGIIQKIIQSIEEGKEFAINNNGQQIRDYIFVEDVANYLKFLIEADPEKKVDIFNICTGQGCSIEELIVRIQKVAKKNLIRKKGFTILEKNVVIGDNRKIVKASGFKPKFNIESGLEKAYHNYLKTK